MKTYGLVADVGGTNVRFALVDLDQPAPALLHAPRKLVSKVYGGIGDAARVYLSEVKLDVPPLVAVLAVAGPVQNGAISLTNLGWNFKADELQSELGIGRVQLINDFEAIAHSVPLLAAGDLLAIGPVLPRDGTKDRETVAIVGPGTGLGVGGYIRTRRGVFPFVTEGGHADFAPFDEVEIEVLKFLRRSYRHVSNERVLSGQGLVNLHRALSAIDGVAYEELQSHEITERAMADVKSFCAKVLARFCAIMGSVTGNVALVTGARDGVLVAGGILPAVAQSFAASAFRARFEAKGRFADYMKAIPTRLIVQEYAGLMGAAAALRDDVGVVANGRA